MKPTDINNVGDAERLKEGVSHTTEVVIEPANPRRTPIDELHGLARRITRGSSKITVRFAYHDQKVGKFGITWAEIIHIWLPRIEDALAAAMVIEISKAAISWARKRIGRHLRPMPRYFYIYAEDGRVLREIQVKGRSEEPEIIVPTTQQRVGRRSAPLRGRAYGNCRYALVLARRFLKTAAVKVLLSPQILSSAIRRQIQARAQRRKLQLYEEKCHAAEIQKTLRRLVIEKIRPSHEWRGGKLKENVTYGNVNETVQFDTVFEHEDRTPPEVVYIHYARHGSRKEETSRYAETLAQFQEKCKDYRRLTGRGAIAVSVLVVPKNDPRRNSQIDLTLFPGLEGFRGGWVFSYEELGYHEEQMNQKTTANSSTS